MTWVPPAFETSVLGPVRRGDKARVTVQELVGWFGFSRRGTQVNAYIRQAFDAHGLACSPDVEKAFPNDTLTIVGKGVPATPLRPQSQGRCRTRLPHVLKLVSFTGHPERKKLLPL